MIFIKKKRYNDFLLNTYIIIYIYIYINMNDGQFPNTIQIISYLSSPIVL